MLSFLRSSYLEGTTSSKLGKGMMQARVDEVFLLMVVIVLVFASKSFLEEMEIKGNERLDVLGFMGVLSSLLYRLTL